MIVSNLIIKYFAEDGDNLDSRNDNKLRRKEMGLDWMSMPAKNQDSELAPKGVIVLEPQSNPVSW